MNHKITIKLNVKKKMTQVKIVDCDGETFEIKYALKSKTITFSELERCIAIIENVCRNK